VILVRAETSPEDIHGMKAARGILTARGGMTSHAAVVARGMGKSCVAGCSSVSDQLRARDAQRDDPGRRAVTLRGGDLITLDGGTGTVYIGALPTVPASLTDEFAVLMTWADAVRTAACARQRRHPARRAHRAELRRGGHRPVPHRAHVLRRRAHRAVREMILASDVERERRRS
jgi:pyruvate,orthophosphate dikinase